MLKKGWLKRQLANAEKEIEGWPSWMRREAEIGLEYEKPRRFSMDLDKLIPMSRGMKVINRNEAWARRELQAKRIGGEKIGRDWWMYKTEVKRLSELYPVKSMEV